MVKCIYLIYFQDAALEFGIVAESFETSVPWDRCEALCRNVKHRVKEVKQKVLNYLPKTKLTNF